MDRNRLSATDIGDRLELFFDELIASQLDGDARLHVHQPQSHDVVLEEDSPWESGVNYFAVLRDGGVYRMYYRGFHHGKGEEARGEPMCYAESADGITWTKPALGLFEFEGSAQNNIVLGGDRRRFPATSAWQGSIGDDPDLGFRGDFVPFKDDRAGVPADARYKALIRGCRGPHQIESRRTDHGMYPFKSPDGIHWTLMTDKPVITKGNFDSQNLGCRDEAHHRYVAFTRDITWITPAQDRAGEGEGDAEDLPKQVCRDIRMSTSKDFVHWSEPAFLEYCGAEREELYTNAVQPYDRAPHMLLGFPTRYLRDTSQTEPTLMISRDGGRTFRRWTKALIDRHAPLERDGNRSNYMATGLVRGNDREYFVYATEGYRPTHRLRRFSYRVDGFVSIRADAAGGRVLSSPLIFSGEALHLNYATRDAGEVRVEMQDADGRPIEGCMLADCDALRGDAIEHRVTWQGQSEVAHLAHKPVRLCFDLRHADVFSLQFKSMAR